MTTKHDCAARKPKTIHNLLLLIGFCALAFTACSGGYETEEATEVCKRDEQGQGSCFNADVMAQCIACYEDCGTDCSQAETCPLQYSCPD